MTKVIYSLTCECNGFGNEPDYKIFFDKLTHVHFHVDLATPEEAYAFAAQFPKSIKLKAAKISGRDNKVWGTVWLNISLYPDWVNKGVNEAGIKRIKSFVKNCEKLGIAIEPKEKYCGNEVQDVRDLESYGLK